MGASIDTGPQISYGSNNPQQNDNPDAGPSLFYAGAGLVDPRFTQGLGSAPNFGSIYGMFGVPQLTFIDAYPAAPNSSAVASNASGIVVPTTGSIAFSLGTTTSLAAAPGVPLVPWVTTRNSSGNGISSTTQGIASANVVACTVLDPGAAIFTLPATGTTTATSLTAATSPNAVQPVSQAGASFPANQIITVLAQSVTNWKNPLKFYQPGQWVFVPGAGNAAGTVPLVAKVVALDQVNSYMVLDRICLNTSANSTGVGVGNMDPTGVTAWPYYRMGAIATADFAQMTARNLSVVSSNAGDTSIILTVNGYDCYGQPLTEAITTNGTSIVLGKKAFKYIASANLSKSGGVTTAGTITIGTAATTTGLFGFPLYVDQFEYVEIFVNGAEVTANTGFTAGLTFVTNPATTTTVDNRGTYAMQTAPSGAVRISARVNLPPYQAGANLLNYTPMFGLTQT